MKEEKEVKSKKVVKKIDKDTVKNIDKDTTKSSGNETVKDSDKEKVRSTKNVTRKKSTKKSNIKIDKKIILIIFIVVIIIAVVLLFLLNKDDNNAISDINNDIEINNNGNSNSGGNNNEKGDSNGDLSHSETSIKKLDNSKDWYYWINRNDKCLVDYPVININLKKVVELNKEFEKHAKSSGYTEKRDDVYLYGVQVVKNHLVVRESHSVNDRTTGESLSDYKYYVINLSNGEFLNNKEILALYNFDEKKVYKSFMSLGDGFSAQHFEIYKSIDDIAIAPYDDKNILAMVPAGLNKIKAYYDGTKFTKE